MASPDETILAQAQGEVMLTHADIVAAGVLTLEKWVNYHVLSAKNIPFSSPFLLLFKKPVFVTSKSSTLSLFDTIHVSNAANTML